MSALHLFGSPKPKYDTIEVKLRLNLHLEEALRFLLCDFSGVCGLKSTFGAQMDAIANASSPGHGRVEVENGVAFATHVPERWAMEHDASFRSRVHRAYLAFSALEAVPGSKHGLVLYQLYGHKNRMAEWGIFGEYAQVAYLTNAAIAHARRLTAKRYTLAANERAYRSAVAPVSQVAALDCEEPILSKVAVREIARIGNKELIALVKVEADHLIIAACAAYSRSHREATK